MKEIEKLRREIRADFALTLGLQGDMTKRLERAEADIGAMQGSLGQMQGTVARLQSDVEQLQGHVGQLQGHVGQLHMGQRASIEVSRKIEGQLRKTGERFDKVLRVVTEEFAPLSELVGLEARFEARFAEIERRLSA